MTGIAAFEELSVTDISAARLPPFEDEPAPPTPTDAIIISDLHLGAENCQAKPLAAFLQSILDGEFRTQRLIINGDVFDSIDFRRLKKTHWKVLSLIRHLSDKLEVIWIVGNHDGSAEIISHLLGVTVVEQYTLTSAGRKLLIIHGHQFDDFINDHPILTWLADLGYWFLQKIDRSHHIARLAKRRSKTFVRCTSKIQTGAQALAKKLNCDAAICGHTHHPLTIEPTADTLAYYNSGCWTESPSTYLVLAEGQVTLKTPALQLNHAG